MIAARQFCTLRAEDGSRSGQNGVWSVSRCASWSRDFWFDWVGLGWTQPNPGCRRIPSVNIQVITAVPALIPASIFSFFNWSVPQTRRKSETYGRFDSIFPHARQFALKPTPVDRVGDQDSPQPCCAGLKAQNMTARGRGSLRPSLRVHIPKCQSTESAAQDHPFLAGQQSI